MNDIVVGLAARVPEPSCVVCKHYEYQLVKITKFRRYRNFYIGDCLSPGASRTLRGYSSLITGLKVWHIPLKAVRAYQCQTARELNYFCFHILWPIILFFTYLFFRK